MVLVNLENFGAALMDELSIFFLMGSHLGVFFFWLLVQIIDSLSVLLLPDWPSVAEGLLLPCNAAMLKLFPNSVLKLKCRPKPSSKFVPALLTKRN